MTAARFMPRGIAALIDLALCYAILYSVALVTGNATEGGGFHLSNGPLLLGLALCLAYFVMLEALWGVTIGKLAANLRVISVDDAGPIGWSGAIIRNILRAVDGLVLYLVGFIAICVTSKHQRLGDLAARSVVVTRRRRHATGPEHPASTRAEEPA